MDVIEKFYKDLKEKLEIKYLSEDDVYNIIESLQDYEPYDLGIDYDKPVLNVNVLFSVRIESDSVLYSKISSETHRLDLKDVLQLYLLILLSFNNTEYNSNPPLEVLCLSKGQNSYYYLGLKDTLYEIFKNNPEYFVSRNSADRDNIDKVKSLKITMIGG